MGELLSVAQVADRRGMSRQAVVWAIQTERLPAQRIGRIWAVKPEDADRLEVATPQERGRRGGAAGAGRAKTNNTSIVK